MGCKGRFYNNRPQIILADEPTGALDSATSQEVMELLRKVNTEMGMTIICVRCV